jgi:23S rRNA (adenine2030-N6)-methyltransferase
MNYRHAYHAGNFADVVKHVILARILVYMKLKPQPFRLIDTHAGIGLYDLEGLEAGKTSEWKDGIGRIMTADFRDPVRSLFAPYFEAVAAVNTPGSLKYYPGSPLIARHLMRREDALVLNEWHAEDCALLKAATLNMPNTRVLSLDGWVAIKSLLPPKERRGVILIDPPFEAADEFDRVAAGLADGVKRFPSGVFVIWYPVKSAAADRFVEAVASVASIKALDARLRVCAPFPGLGLTETGLLIVNPPYSLRSELDVILPALADVLEQENGHGYSLHAWGL